MDRPIRILIVSEHASTRFGGEAILPWHYFRALRQRGFDARLVVHQRTRSELLELLPGEAGRMYFLADTVLNRLAWKMGRFLPPQISYLTLGYLSRISTQLAARDLARRLVAEFDIDVVHQPIPVSPREPSFMYALGAPVIMGPMNGNMTYPAAFRNRGQQRFIWFLVRIGRLASELLNSLIPGKLQAAALLVANSRTRAALPGRAGGKVVELTENGVDLETWSPAQRSSVADRPVRFVFLGRLVDWKAVDALLDAFAQVRIDPLPELDILGDGPMRSALEDRAGHLGLGRRVRFHGWQSQAECARRLQQADALVLPSLYESGGAVVLEAMACGLPVIATDWGGPADYLDASCGILVRPASRPALVSGFAQAMHRLALNPALRAALGQAGRDKVMREFDWKVKIDRMLEIYRDVLSSPGPHAGS